MALEIKEALAADVDSTWVTAVRKTSSVSRDTKRVTLRATATSAIVDLMFAKDQEKP